MKKFSAYTTDDFLADEFFVEWVRHPSPSSDRYWSSVMDRYPETRERILEASNLVKSFSYKEGPQLDEDEYRDLMHSIFTDQSPVRQVKENKRGFHFYWKVAAVFCLITGLFWFFYSFPPGETKVLEQAVDRVEVSTKYGQKRTLKLSDGTSIKLNAGSRIDFPKQFGDNSRDLILVGEAFFDVAHDENRPFIITSKGLTTKVLGTSFNIKAYQDEEEVAVGVVTGKVYIESGSGFSELLEPKEMGYYGTDKTIKKRKFDPGKEIAWTEGKLIFEKEKIPEVFKKLEKWYGISIEINGEVELSGSYSGEYHDKSLELVLEGIGYTSNFDFIIRDSIVQINPKKMD